MPIYEYRCPPCDHTFETLLRNTSDVAHCPKCGTLEVAKQFSVPAAPQGASGSMALPVCAAPGQPSFGCGVGGGGCGSGMCSTD